MSAVIYLSIALLVIYSIFQIALLFKSFRMKKREKQLIENGVKPYGSTLCHGMVIDRQGNGKSVKHDQKPSDSWYSRLA